MKKKIRYHIEPNGALTRVAVCFMALSMALRAVWCLLWPEEVSAAGMTVHALLPLCACALFIVGQLHSRSRGGCVFHPQGHRLCLVATNFMHSAVPARGGAVRRCGVFGYAGKEASCAAVCAAAHFSYLCTGYDIAA